MSPMRPRWSIDSTWRARAAALTATAILGCSGGGSTTSDAATAPTPDALASPRDARVTDAQPATDAAAFDPGPEPTTVIQPKPGELTIIQLDLPPGLTFRLGEAAIIVGPDGTIALLDMGNSVHDDEVRAAVIDLNTNRLTPANGFPARDERQVDWVIVTHVHGDHVGAFEKLFVNTSVPLDVRRGIVHRGFVDLGAGMNTGDYDAFCAGMRGTYASVDVPLCETTAMAPCSFGALAGAYEATGCPGLHVGDLSTAADDSAGAPSFIDLGGGARITLVAANGHVSNGTDAIAAAAFGHDDSNEENARSLAGIISFGSFRYHFGGDMTGSGATGQPDVESHLVTTAGATFYGARGVDMAHTHHHARRTSSNATLVNALAPEDGRSRNAIAGINAAHLNSPHAQVLAAWADNGRLGDGYFWVTKVATGGDTHARLIDADGPVVLQTVQGGRGYRVQAAGATLQSHAFQSVRDN